MQPRHAAGPQGLDVVAVGLALEGGALAKPAAGRNAGVGHGLALRVVGAHLEQPVDHTKPIGGGAAGAAQGVAGAGVGHFQVFGSALALVGLEQVDPGNGFELGVGERAAALVQAGVGGHGAYFWVLLSANRK